MKKKATYIVLCLSLIIVWVIIGSLCGGRAYNKLVIGEEEYELIISSHKQVSFKNPNLRMNGTGCFYSESSRSFYYSLNSQKNSSFNPNVTVRTDSENVKIAFLENRITRENINNNITTKVILYNKNSFCEYNLICTTLPLLSIDCPKDINEEEHKMSMLLYDNGSLGLAGLIQSEGTIRYRGATTLYYPKKGFKISLTQKSVGENKRTNPISLLGMRKDDDWVLYAAYNDQEKIRNVFSQNLWKATCSTDNERGIDESAEYRYVELFVNGDYYGLYALGSPVDETSYMYDDNTSKNALYKSIYWSDLYGIMMPENVVTAYEVKTPEKNYHDGRIDNADWDLFLDYCYYLEDNKYDDDALLKGIDLDNAVDMFLFFNLIQGMDTTYGPKAKNYYMGISRQKDGSLKALYTPWDMDISWGNFWTGDIDINFTVPYGVKSDVNYLFEHGYLNRLIVNGNQTVPKAISTKYNELRSSVWSDEAIVEILDEYEKEIYESGAYLRDKERWPEGTYQNRNDLSVFKAYVIERMTEYDAYIQRFLDLYEESILVKRSAQYKNFKDSKFLIVINEDDVIYDSDYSELLKYIGIDVSKLSSSTKAIIYDGKTNVTALTDEWLGLGYELETAAGTLSTKRNIYSDSTENGEWIYLSESDYSVYLDGVFCYDTLTGYEPDIRIYFVYDGIANTMDLTKDYNLDVRFDTFNDMYLYLKALRMFGYDVAVSYSDENIFEDEKINNAFNALEGRINYNRTDTVNGISFVIADEMSGEIKDSVLFTYKIEKEKATGKSKFVTLSCTRE